MTLQQLEYIVALDQFRHFTKAAEYCRVTQPTLSAMIQKLEEELGVQIFDRSRQPIIPTSVGILIIKHAREILVQSGEFKNIIAEQKERLSGKFRVAVLPTIAPYLLPRFFTQFLRKYSGLDVQVVEMKTNEMKQAIAEGAIDAGILAQVSGLEDFNNRHLFYEQFYAYVSRKEALFERNVIRTSDLTGQMLWLLDEGHCFRDQMVKFCSIKSARDSKAIYQLGSMETFMRMVESGRGMTFVPQLATLQMSQSQLELVRSFAIPAPARQIILITNKNFIRETLVQTVISEIQASVPSDMLALKPTQVAI